MPVFLSHKKEDTQDTLNIANYLKTKHNISCYVDVFDPSLKTTSDITTTLMRRVRECSHIMAIVSEKTTISWWVPFEIGVASQLDRRITTFQITTTSLPDFLQKWPILKTPNDLDAFAQFYKNDRSILFSEGRSVTASINSADEFHRNLKLRIGQH